MLKVLLGLMLGSFILGPLAAQVKKSPTTPITNAHLRVFEQAARAGDVSTAIIALNYYLQENPTRQVYGDTLAMLYMQQGAFRQCLYWAEKRLSVTPGSNQLLELKGVCLDKLQRPREAIEVFEQLLEKTKSPYHGYKLMELQYGMKRLQECLASGRITERLEFKPAFTITYTAGQQVGRTYLEAGVYNIIGLACYDLGQYPVAKTYFQKALALDTSFLLAKQNLAIIVQQESGRPPLPAAPNGDQPASSPGNKEN